MKTRTLAREAALQYLYEIDMVGPEDAERIEPFLERQLGRVEARDYAGAIIEGVLERIEEIDRALIEASQNWTVDRMPVVDRNVLRIGVYELLYREDVPPKVAINEAINVAKRFSTSESAAFVNGILDRVRLSSPRCDEEVADGESDDE